MTDVSGRPTSRCATEQKALISKQAYVFTEMTNAGFGSKLSLRSATVYPSVTVTLLFGVTSQVMRYYLPEVTLQVTSYFLQ